jgi:hypothetical protein
MVTYSCDRCSGVVGGPGGLFSLSFSSIDGNNGQSVGSHICQGCLNDAVTFIETPVVIDGITIIEKVSGKSAAVKGG